MKLLLTPLVLTYWSTFPYIFADYILPETPLSSRIGIYLKGAFHVEHDSNATNFLHVYIQLLTLNAHSNATDIPDNKITFTENLTSIYTIPLVGLDEIDVAPETKHQIVFNVGDAAFAKVHNEKAVLRVQMTTDLEDNLPLVVAYDPSPIDKDAGVMYAAIVLLGLYVMIIWEVVHRTFAAMLASSLSLAILAAMNEKPSMGELMGWIDVETLLLLFGMMILVAILSETGIFDFLAVYAYKVKWEQIEHKEWTSINFVRVDYGWSSMAADQLSLYIYRIVVIIFGQCYNRSVDDTC